MIHTRDTLDIMSDHDVNKTFAELIGWDVADSTSSAFLSERDWLEFKEEYPNTIWARDRIDGFDGHAWEQYCFTALDSYDILIDFQLEHGISLLLENGELPKACAGIRTSSTPDQKQDLALHIETEHSDKNPLRAIVCCLILVLQKEQAKTTA